MKNGLISCAGSFSIFEAQFSGPQNVFFEVSKKFVNSCFYQGHDCKKFEWHC